jgi:hypothetical protein
MFTIDPQITDLKVREKNITKILFSMNIHQVATPEMMLEDARSYVLFFRESKGRYSAYIALHLLTTNRRLYYSYFSNQFSEEQLDAVEEEALAFVEGLGAMIDELDFSNMSDSAQDRWLDEQDIFSEKPKTEAQPAPQPETPPAQPIAAPIQPQPETPPAQPIAASIQPQPVAPPAQPIAAPIQPQPVAPPVQPIVAPIRPQPKQQKSAAKQQQEIMQQAIKASIAKSTNKTSSKEAQPIAGVVSRDREALARLLASF